MNIIFKNFALLLIFNFFLIVSCTGGDVGSKKIVYSNLNDIPDASWEKLSQEKIYFGHQSVGFNIIDGIKDLMEENPKIRLNIFETTDSNDFNSGVFAHSKVGKNQDPSSKVGDFVKNIDSGIGKSADYAALKFCYVDLVTQTKVQEVFDNYVKAIKSIKAVYPDLTIIHFTAPLTTNQSTWKTWIKKIMGKKYIWEYMDNGKRNQYNEMLLAEFKGKEPVFDIATIESTRPDGSRCRFEYNGKTYYSMVPEYTNDDGHLNAQGRKLVAAEFLITLLNEL